MKLVAIYLNDHEYLFDKPQTINFGGQYSYSFSEKDKVVTINRRLNKNFIDNFFDLTNLDSKISNVSAIAGQNGAGKSTLLDVIRSEFIENPYSLPHSNSIFVFEVGGSKYPMVLKNDFKRIFLHLSSDEIEKDKSTTPIELKTLNPQEIRTIYYSPHFDYKYNPNFSNIDDHDISFDKILELDLDELNEKDVNGSGLTYSPNQELLFKNSLRQIEFLNSELVKNHSIFKNIFHLPDHNDSILIFRGYKPKDREWNMPNAFRSGAKIVEDKIEKELNAWHKIRKLVGSEVVNQVEINRYILKRNIIKDILSLIYHQMEKNNSYLDEGSFSYDSFKAESGEMDGLNAFFLFIDNCFVEIGRGTKTQRVFDRDNLKKLIYKIYESIDNAKDESSVENEKLKANKDDAIEILKLQREFLRELFHYYYLFDGKDQGRILTDNDRIEGFVNYMPFSKKLSSGENALLNLFSRLYDFINSNLKIENRFYNVHDHYLLLLDEADLGFHPSWKKRYVKALISTIPHFFNELENKPGIQIVFTTHDPFALSDLPNTNVVYIERSSYDVDSCVMDDGNLNRPLKTFGANISDLLADSFFLKDSLIGDFAYEIISKTIDWLNDKKNSDNFEYYKKVIQTIDEPIVQRKLSEMYDVKMKEKFELSILDEQIRKLQNLKKKFD
jgi:predicted ATP-binding protein involved in virulence